MKIHHLIFFATFLASFNSCQKEEMSVLDKEANGLEQKANTKNPKYQIGQEFGGGIVVYIDASGKHGLIIGKEDLIGQWGCYGTLIPNNADGQTMTNNIIVGCSEPGIAARLCDEYVVYETGNSTNSSSEKGRKYDDWFMASVDETRLAGATYWNYLTIGAVYWTGVQATYFVSELNPAEYVQTIQPYSYAIDGVTYVGIGPGVSAKNNLRAVRPWRKF